MVKKSSIVILFLIIYSLLFITKVNAQQSIEINPKALYATGEVIVEFQDNSDPVTINKMVQERAARADTAAGQLMNRQEDTAFALQGISKPEDKQQALNLTINDNEINQIAKINENIYLYHSDKVTDVANLLESYNQLDFVKKVTPNYVFNFMETPNDYFYPRQWALPKMKFNQAWDINKGSNNVKVAIIDSGTDRGHPDLQANLSDVKVITGADAAYYSAHGTHVAGIIAATTNNSIGVAGGIQKVNLISLKADSMIDTSQGKKHGLKLDVVIRAIEYAVSQNVDVINMSIGSPVDEPLLKNAIDVAYNQGITIVAASGNSGQEDYFYPAAYSNVISVGAVGPNDELAHYSTWGDYLDVVASGGNPAGQSESCKTDDSDCILSSWHRSFACLNTKQYSNYCSAAGTSMAAPFVSGAAALLLSVKNNLTPNQIYSYLTQGAFDLGPSGRDDKYGYGRLDIKKSIDFTAGQPTLTPIMATSFPSPTLYSISIYSTPTPGNDGQHPCYDKALKGDYNCDGMVNLDDLNKWLEDCAVKIDLFYFELIRRNYFAE